MSVVALDISDEVTPEMKRIIKRTRNMRPAMRRVDVLVMRPLRNRSWDKSGLDVESGELKESVETFHGKKSAGISVHTKPGKDKVIPKSVFHTEGAKRHEYRRKKRYRVRDHTRAGRRVSAHYRSNVGSPWGDVKARPFIPTRLSANDTRLTARILERFITDA